MNDVSVLRTHFLHTHEMGLRRRPLSAGTAEMSSDVRMPVIGHPRPIWRP